MQYNIKKLPKSQVELSASLSTEEFGGLKESALLEYAKEAEIEGFRKGKAPVALVKERIGEERISGRAAEAAVKKYYREIAEKEKLDVIGHPDAAITKSDSLLEFTVTVSLFPIATLPDYRAIAKKTMKERKSVSVEKKEIDESVRWLQESRAATITVPGGAAKGDRVEIDFTVKNNGVVIEGGKSENHPLIVGSGKFVPGFEDMLIGMKASEAKSFSLTMPEGYANDLGGKSLDFSVAMRLVQERHLPEVTDDFARGLGKFESVGELEKNIERGLMQEKEEKERQRLDMAIADEIAKCATVDVPDVLIDSELEKMTHEFEGNIQRMGMELEKYLAHIKKTIDDMKKEWRPDAERRVRIALSLRKIADAEHIEPSDEEVEEHANKNLDIFRAEGHDIQKIDKRALADYSRSIVRNQKVFEFLEKQA